MITADQARANYGSDDYVESIRIVNEAITSASRTARRVEVNVPTGLSNPPTSYHVAEGLRRAGFTVVLIHDPENGSSELTINW
jgi:hypothetical protein